MPRYLLKKEKDNLEDQQRRILSRLKARLCRDKSVSSIGGLDQATLLLDGTEPDDRVDLELLARIDRILWGDPPLMEPAVVVALPTNTERVAIGHLVTVNITVGDTESTVMYRIGGFEQYDDTVDPVVISYNSPCGGALLGKRVREITFVDLPRGLVELEVVQIELPPPQPEQPRVRVPAHVKTVAAC